MSHGIHEERAVTIYSLSYRQLITTRHLGNCLLFEAI